MRAEPQTIAREELWLKLNGSLTEAVLAAARRRRRRRRCIISYSALDARIAVNRKFTAMSYVLQKGMALENTSLPLFLFRSRAANFRFLEIITFLGFFTPAVSLSLVYFRRPASPSLRLPRRSIETICSRRLCRPDNTRVFGAVHYSSRCRARKCLTRRYYFYFRIRL